MSTVTGSPEELAPFDPFELQDVVSGNIRDPYPRMHELRRLSPVHLGPVDLGDGANDPDPDRPPGVTVFGYDEVVQVLRDNDTYSSTIYEGVMGLVMGRTILQMDEPEHHTYRGIVQQAFSRKTMERWEVEAITPIIDEHIDAFIDRGRAELVRELPFPFPVRRPPAA